MVSWPWSLDAGHDYKPPSSQRAALGYLMPLWQEYLLHGHGTPLLALQFALEQDACAVVDYGDLVRGGEDLAQLVHDDPLLALRSLRAAVHAQLPELLMPRNESTLTIGRYGRSLHRISARELLREHIVAYRIDGALFFEADAGPVALVPELEGDQRPQRFSMIGATMWQG